MRSSPAYAALALELPPVTLADRLAAGLTMAAGAYGAAVLTGQDQVALAAVMALAGASRLA